MNNKTFFIASAAVVALITYCIWLAIQQSKLKKEHKLLQGHLNIANSQNHYLSHQNQVLINENNSFKKGFNQ